jgi:hypothetical protein
MVARALLRALSSASAVDSSVSRERSSISDRLGHAIVTPTQNGYNAKYTYCPGWAQAGDICNNAHCLNNTHTHKKTNLLAYAPPRECPVIHSSTAAPSEFANSLQLATTQSNAWSKHVRSNHQIMPASSCLAPMCGTADEPGPLQGKRLHEIQSASAVLTWRLSGR